MARSSFYFYTNTKMIIFQSKTAILEIEQSELLSFTALMKKNCIATNKNKSTSKISYKDFELLSFLGKPECNDNYLKQDAKRFIQIINKYDFDKKTAKLVEKILIFLRTAKTSGFTQTQTNYENQTEPKPNGISGGFGVKPRRN